MQVYNDKEIHNSVIIAARISSSDGLTGNPVQVRDDPVTVNASELHDVTESTCFWEGAASAHA